MKLPNLLPEQASTFAKSVDELYLFVVAVTAVIFVLVSLVAIIFFYRYRRKSEGEVPEPIEGNLPLEIIWSVIPLILLMVMFFWGTWVYFKINKEPENALPIYVVGKQWMWKIQHPDGAREINELHVPVDTPIKLLMTSEDVIHSFYIPAFRVKKDTVPGRYTQLWFEATKVGTYHLFCAEYCGTKHSQMIGQVHVLSQQDYAKWLGSGLGGGDSAPIAITASSPGEAVFKKYLCNTCHMSANPVQLGPRLENIFGHEVELQDGTKVMVDENYIRESIYEPLAKVVKGFQPVMPSFKTQVTEQELADVITYIKSLSSSKTAE